MQIQQEVIKAIEKEVLLQGVTVVAKGSKVNYRTLKKILATGKTEKTPYKKLISFLKKEIKDRKEVLQVIEDDQN